MSKHSKKKETAIIEVVKIVHTVPVLSSAQ